LIEFSAALAEGAAKAKEVVEFVRKTEMELGKLDNEELIYEGAKFEEIERYQLPQEITVEQEKLEPFEGKYMNDDIGLKEKTAQYGDSQYINEIREQNEKVDQVLSEYERSLTEDPSDLNYQRVDEKIERYKGTIFEHELKDTLKDKFEVVEDKQRIVETEWGETKPDVIARSALEDIKIGDLEIKKGEDLFIEAKCGGADYIRSEMGHMLKQVDGHEGNSLVVVTKDYLDINPDIRADFEKSLAEKGSHIYVADVYSTDISAGLSSSLRL
jgi:hypothetical protein